MNAVSGMQLVLTVGLSAIASVVALILAFFGLGGWGVALSVWFLVTANTGWRLLAMGVGERGCINNSEKALVMLIFTNFLIGVNLAIHPPYFSSAWALLMPLAVVPCYIIQWGYEMLLNLINPKGKRAKGNVTSKQDHQL